MKTENTLRTVRNSLLCFFMALGAGFLVACGGGGGGVSSNEGTFHANDWVVGLDYTYLDNGETGKTGEKGVFPLRGGQSIAFSIGQVTLGTLSSISEAIDDFITPTRLGIGDDAGKINVEQLLIALDSDGDNGTISLDENSATDAAVVMSVLANNVIADDLMTLSVGVEAVSVTVERVIRSETVARGLLENTNNCAFSGAFEGRWRQTFGAFSTGETALVLLAFNDETLPAVSDPLGDDDDANAGISQLTDANRMHNGGALYIDMWKRGGSSQTPVEAFGVSSGAVAIGLNGFPLALTITTAADDVNIIPVITLTVESYDRMTYTSAGETGVYRRVNEEVRDADYRIAGFYSDADNDKGEAEIGIYAFSANKGGGSVRPYVGWFSSPLTGDDSSSVYSNIGEGGISSLLTYTGTPESSGGMTFTEEDGSSFTVDSFTNIDGRGYGTYEEDTGENGEIESLVGGWCAL